MLVSCWYFVNLICTWILILYPVSIMLEYPVYPLFLFGRPERQSCFPIGLKNTNLVEDIKLLLPVKFCWFPFSSVREVENVTANQRPERPFYFSGRSEKNKLGKWTWNLSACQDSLNSVQWFQRKSKMSPPIRGRGGHLVFLIGTKNTNLVENIEIFLPVKFRWIPSIGEVGNALANQRPGWPPCFSDRPEKQKLVDDVEILLPVTFRWTPFSGSKEKSKMYQPIIGRAAILFSWSA